MVYIIGVDHLIQYNGPVPAHLLEEFKTYLKDMVRSHGITLIAEEFNEEFLHDVYGATEDTARLVAAECSVEHRYCDPDEAGRLKLGIPYFADIKETVKKKFPRSDQAPPDPLYQGQVLREAVEESKKFWGIRELYWMEAIADRICENIVFICGHEHVFRFRDLLLQEGHEAAVYEEFWRKDIFSDYAAMGLR